MKVFCFSGRVTAGVMTLMLGGASFALGAPGPAQGETSGPASGSQTVPSAAVQKQASNPNGSTVAGAPGVAGKQGGESGSKPANGPSKSH